MQKNIYRFRKFAETKSGMQSYNKYEKFLIKGAKSLMKRMAFSFVVIALVLFGILTTANALGRQSIAAHPTVETEAAYMTKLSESNGKWYITLDPIEWYEGEAADKALHEHEPDADIDHAPDGYYIVNNSTETKTYEIAPDAAVLMQIYDHDGTNDGVQINWNEPITVSKLGQLYANTDILDLSVYPYHITLEDGKVVNIVQQYIP